jgi:hypothetical protein
LRCFAAKNFQTVEQTVKSSAVFLSPIFAVAFARVGLFPAHHRGLVAFFIGAVAFRQG